MIKVQDSTGNKHELTARLEKMVSLIVENAGEIVRPQNVQVVFDCAGGAVSASIKKTLETQRPEARPVLSENFIGQATGRSVSVRSALIPADRRAIILPGG